MFRMPFLFATHWTLYISVFGTHAVTITQFIHIYCITYHNVHNLAILHMFSFRSILQFLAFIHITHLSPSIHPSSYTRTYLIIYSTIITPTGFPPNPALQSCVIPQQCVTKSFMEFSAAHNFRLKWGVKRRFTHLVMTIKPLLLKLKLVPLTQH